MLLAEFDYDLKLEPSFPILDPTKPHRAYWYLKKYGLPFIMDLSVWVYNKDLFTKAGLDPNKPPTTLAEYQADADAIQKLGLMLTIVRAPHSRI